MQMRRHAGGAGWRGVSRLEVLCHAVWTDADEKGLAFSDVMHREPKEALTASSYLSPNEKGMSTQSTGCTVIPNVWMTACGETALQHSIWDDSNDLFLEALTVVAPRLSSLAAPAGSKPGLGSIGTSGLATVARSRVLIGFSVTIPPHSGCISPKGHG